MFLFLNGLATAAAAEPAQNVVALSQLLVVAKNLINAAAEETKNNKNSNSNSNKNIKNNNKKRKRSSLKGSSLFLAANFIIFRILADLSRGFMANAVLWHAHSHRLFAARWRVRARGWPCATYCSTARGKLWQLPCRG